MIDNSYHLKQISPHNHLHQIVNHCPRRFVPGLSKDNVDIEIKDGILTIRGDSNQRGDIEDSQYARREVKRSAFARSFQLGDNLDQTNVTAAYENGILTLTIPKMHPTVEESVVRKIAIS